MPVLSPARPASLLTQNRPRLAIRHGPKPDDGGEWVSLKSAECSARSGSCKNGLCLAVQAQRNLSRSAEALSTILPWLLGAWSNKRLARSWTAPDCPTRTPGRIRRLSRWESSEGRRAEGPERRPYPPRDGAKSLSGPPRLAGSARQANPLAEELARSSFRIVPSTLPKRKAGTVCVEIEDSCQKPDF